MWVCHDVHTVLDLLHITTVLCYVGVPHTPTGLQSPESEEDTDREQRRLLAMFEP